MSRTIHTRVLPLADLPASYEEFTSRLGKKLRGHVRRQEQTALQQHGLSWRLNDEGSSLASAVQAFAELHQQCWQHRGKNGNLAETRFRAFVERFAESASRRGWLRLHRLCDGPRTVAALLAFHHHGRAYYYQSGWDPAIAKLSPGSLCVARAVRTAIEEGLTVFDFLRGDESYKRRWSNRQDETITVAEAATLKGQAMLAGRDVKELLKRGIVALGGSAAWEGFKTRLLTQTRTPQPQRGDC
jgi:CelD/BcsL family acetyltransferase involved in cellulose biosynthesis